MRGIRFFGFKDEEMKGYERERTKASPIRAKKSLVPGTAKLCRSEGEQ